MEALMKIDDLYTDADMNKIRKSQTYEVVLCFKNKRTGKLTDINDKEAVEWIASHIRSNIKRSNRKKLSRQRNRCIY